MTDDELASLSRELQKAFDSRDLEAVLSFYHPDIVLVSPSYPKPVTGMDSLREAVKRQFAGPQRTDVRIEGVKTLEICKNAYSTICEISGRQSIYYSTYDFRGIISRVIVITDNGPRIISEHFSLLK